MFKIQGIRVGASKAGHPSMEVREVAIGRQMITQSLFFPETGRFSKKNREAIEHERAITERD